MSELTEQINEVTKGTEENRDCVDTLSRLPVADSPLISTDQTGMELKTSPAQVLTDSTTAFHSTPSPPRSFISTVDRSPLTTAASLRPNTSAETSLVLDVDASNANTNDLDFPPVQSSEVASCPASPMTPHQEITTGTVITSPNVQFRSASGSNKLPPKTTQCSSPVTNPPHTVTTTASATVKRSRQKPDQRRELLIRAVEDVLKNNISMRRAAQKHNLAKSSLCDFVRKNNIPLPNLRVKNCPPTSDCSSIPSLSRRVGTPTAATTTALGLKRVPSETNEFQPEVKLVCPADRKPGVLNKYRDPGTYSNENSPIGRTNSSHAVPHPSSTFSDSPLALDVLDSDHSVRKSPYTSTRSGHATSNSIAVTSSISSNAVSACTSSGGSTLLSTRSNYSTSKTNRIESPWYNSAGLPTQVPMRSWTVTHHPNPLNGNASTAGTHCNLYNEHKQRTNHSLSQLRQTLDKSGVVMNLSDPTSQVDTPTSNLVRNLTESTGNSAAETHGARQTPISEDGESGLTSDGSELLKKQPYDIHIPASSQPFQYCDMRQFLTALLGSVLPKTVNLMSNLNARPSNTNTASTAAVTAPDNLLPNPLHLQDTCSNLLDSSMSTNMTKMQSHAKGLIDFINKSPSPFHAVQAACDLLTANGFRELKEHEPWKLRPSDCVFIRKNGTTVVAAAVGGKFKPGNPFHMIGAHTDSPCLRLKPFSERVKEGYIQLGVETYGGGLWYTWFDRELKVAGRAVTANAAGRLEERLVHLDRPIACVPSLAIHLNQEIKVQGFQPNTEQHVAPILCTCLMDQVQNVDGVENAQSPLSALGASTNASPTTQLGKRRHPAGLLRVIAQDLGVSEHDILELELYFADCQPARIGGLHNEFIHAPRLDNLFNSYTSVCGLVGSLNSLGDDSALRLVCLFDHEEIGSTSTQGANSAHTLNILRRLVDAVVLEPTTDAEKPGASCEAVESGLDAGTPAPATSSSHFEESLSKSFLLSADQAHAVHPSYHERHEPNHKAQLHCGLILKYSSAQRYATNALTAAAVRQVAQRASVPVQEFTPRQDMHCGSTIGPLLSSQLGVPTADVGFPQLAMHSCRELCCTTSVSQAVRFYSAFYEQLPKLWPPERS